MDSWILQPVISPIAIAILIGIALLMLLVGPSFGNLSRWKRIQLACLRLATIGLALTALLRPGCVQKIEKNQSAVMLVLIDKSRSMELPHLRDDSTRWGAMVDTLKENAGRFEQLREKKIEVRFFSFDNLVKPLEEVDGQIVLPATPDGSETDIGSATYATSRDVLDQRVVAMILNSDGVQNALNPDIELSRAADTLSDMEVPLYAVCYGLPKGAGQLKDVAVKNFPEQLSVNLKNRLEARATVVSRGYTNQDITVQLVLENKEGMEQIVGSKRIRPTQAVDEQQVSIDYVPTESGEFRLIMRVLEQPGEVAIRNNELPAFLSVSDRGMRVLFLAGRLNWEQNALKRTIPSASDGINLEFYQIQPFDPLKPGLMNPDPARAATLTKLFNDTTYDVFILGDVDSRALYAPGMRNSPLEALTRAVENGKGLLTLGGFNSFGPGGYGQTPLAAVLPVKLDPREMQTGPDIRLDLHITRDVGLKASTNHYLTRLAGNEDAISGWREMPKLTGANRLIPKDRAEILLETDDSAANPILIAGDPGGRVLAFAGDSTHKWIPRGKREQFDQFWRQIILWLARWDDRDDEIISIEMPQRRFEPRGLVKFNISAKSMDGGGADPVQYQGTLVKPNGLTSPVTLTQSGSIGSGQLERETIASSGVYKLQVTGTRGGQEIGTSEREFIVIDRDREKSNPAADPEQMMRLASETAEFGGRALVPDELGDLLDSIIENPPKTKMEIPTKWQLGETLYDAGGFLLLFVVVVSTEWVLRKKWGLV